MKKIEKNDIIVLRNLQNQYNEFLIEAGQLYLAQNKLDKARSDFEKRLSEFESSEREITKRMNQKYGDGTIDLEKEEFISA
jgi:hypothetical protein